MRSSKGAVGKTLVIVESPAKARTIAKFLGDRYVVESSIGHIRDLPRNAGDVPAEFKKAKWGRLGVDVDHDFQPIYVVDAGKKEHIRKLQQLADKSDEVLLATDEDREGESIAWHLLEVLKPRVPVKRMVFHEITRKAIEHALAHPREVNDHLVDAQEARRILDRLYGYEVSPVLWKKVMPRLSAGRVQSVATRIIVDRERARMRFRKASYWDIDARLRQAPSVAAATGEDSNFAASLTTLDGRRVATGKDFGQSGELEKASVIALDEARVQQLAKALKGAEFRVASVESKPYRRSPAAPFMTSTLQQEAGRKLKFSSARTMQAAQRLYENGHITYMRTDSTTLSDTALQASRAQIAALYGEAYLPAAPRLYKNKVKNAQEAHEAIRPAGDSFRSIEAVAAEVSGDEARLYELIWKRTIASQMQDAQGQSLTVRLAVKGSDGSAAEFNANGNTITFPGFQRAYVEGSDDPQAELDASERRLPPLKEGEIVQVVALEPRSHETQPPARFTEASLVRRLEELGVGRPSTYASIIGTIQERGYVWKQATALVPSFTAFVVVSLLEQHFGDLVDYAFTAKMEDELDAIARGDEQSKPWLKRFYFGNGAGGSGDHADNAAALGLQAIVAKRLGEIDARAINTVALGVDAQGHEIVLRVGRYGPYLQRGEERVSVAEDVPPDELTVERAAELLLAPQGDRVLGIDPVSKSPVLLRSGRFGVYVQLGEEEGSSEEKPKRSSLLSGMTPETLTLETALQLLSLPKTLGKDAASGDEVVLHNGRYGPYITRGSDNRSLSDPSQVFSFSLEDALALLAQPKQRRGRGAAAADPGRPVGKDSVSGKDIVMRKGRFGFYVTDGETNASLRAGDDADGLTLERAQELLQIRRDRGPVPPRAGKARRTPRQAVAKAANAPKSPGTKAAKPSKKSSAPKPAVGATPPVRRKPSSKAE